MIVRKSKGSRWTPAADLPGPEEWRRVPGYLLEASSLGRIRVIGARNRLGQIRAIATSLDEHGVPILTKVLRDALRVAMPVATRAAA